MKAHIGVDSNSGMVSVKTFVFMHSMCRFFGMTVHTVEATAVNEHDITCTSNLLHGKEKVVYADAGYIGVS